VRGRGLPGTRRRTGHSGDCDRLVLAGAVRREPERGGPRLDRAQRCRSRQDAIVRTGRCRSGGTGRTPWADTRRSERGVMKKYTGVESGHGPGARGTEGTCRTERRKVSDGPCTSVSYRHGSGDESTGTASGPKTRGSREAATPRAHGPTAQPARRRSRRPRGRSFRTSLSSSDSPLHP